MLTNISEGKILMAATIKDIAERTGLGLATISKYLNGGRVRPQNKVLIEEAIAKLHFVPNEFARSLKSNHSRTIGVVIPELSNVFITSIIARIEDMLRQQNYAVIVCDCRSDNKREKDAISFLINKRVDGLITMPTDPSGENLRPVLNESIPIVLVDRMIPKLSGEVCAVVVDNTDAAQKMTTCLLDAGHRDIGLILGSRNVYTAQKRWEGYRNAMELAGVPINEKLIRYSDYSMQGGFNAMKELLTYKPTAVFSTNYEMSVGAIIALNEAHLSIPADISMCGFDRFDLFGAITPELTLIKQPLHEISECAGNQMLRMLEQNKQLRQVVILSTKLLHGKSIRRLT